MANPFSSASFNFDDAPGGDISLNDLFGDNQPDTNQSAPPPEGQLPVDQNTDVQAQTPPAGDQPLFRTATGTVYKTLEDAIAGTEHKDALIAQLRQQVAENTGRDPLKRDNQPTTNPESFTENPDLYFSEMDTAVKAGDRRKILDIQKQLFMETMSPYAPMLTNVAKSQAVNQVTSEVADFSKVANTPEFQQTIDSLPLLKNSIQIAESNPQASADLAQLYRIAFDVHSARNLPKTVQVQPATQVNAPVRPTVSSSQMAPPPVSAPPKTAADSRKATIERLMGAGIEDRRF